MVNKSPTKEKYVMICPKCKSPDVYMDKSNPLQPALGLPAMYICNKCKHSGYSFPEAILSKLDEIQEVSKEHLSDTRIDETSLVDTSYGNFQVRVFWKISAPITLLVGIFLFFKEPISGTIITLIGIFTFYVTYFKKRKLKD